MARERKKVLLFITKSNFGGAQRYVYDIATHLDPSEFEPVVVLGGEGQLKAQLEHAHIRTISIPSLERDISLSKEFVVAKDLYQILRTERPHVLHVNSSKAGGIGALLGRLALVPKVYFTAHGWAFNEDRPIWQKLLIKFLHWLTILLAHQTIAVSRGTRLEMNWPLVDKKMVVIYPGRTIGVMYGKVEARQRIAAQISLLSNRPADLWVGTVGELHPTKQQAVGIKAVAKLTKDFPTLHYIIVGEGESRTHLEELIREFKLEHKVHLTGHIDDAARFLKSFDIFLLPSRSEAYPYSITEAGLAELPVVASDVGGIPDVIKTRESGVLFKSGDVEECERALRHLLEERSRRHQYGEALYETVANRSLDKMVAALSVMYRKA